MTDVTDEERDRDRLRALLARVRNDLRRLHDRGWLDELDDNDEWIVRLIAAIDAELGGAMTPEEARRLVPVPPIRAYDLLLQERTELQAKLERAEAELKEVEAFRAEPFRAIRVALGEDGSDESDDEAVAGSVIAIILTWKELSRRKKAAEAAVTRLREALQGVMLVANRKTREFDTAWAALAATEEK